MTDLSLRDLSLRIRPGVATRERPIASGVLFYLSLFDDEIDDRLGRFLEALAANSETVSQAATYLELTDAIVVQTRSQVTAVIRGGACTVPLFWKREGSRFHLATSLPLSGTVRFSRQGFASALASVSLHGSYEPNACTETPLEGWRRLRRGIISTFNQGLLHEQSVPDIATSDSMPQPDAIAKNIQNAFDAFRDSQRHIASSILELSGGFDSTLAGTAAARLGHVMHGVSVEFPYYEFRFEAPLQEAVASALSIERTALDGTGMFPYAPWQHPPRFDEPSVFVTGIRHAECVAEFAASKCATRIYVGHGGDQLFATDLTIDEALSPKTLSFAALSGEFRRAVKRSIHLIRRPQWRHRSSACFVYDARQDVWVKETFGATIRTPFTDTEVFRAAQQWSRYSQALDIRPDKTILAHALASLLPEAVRKRRGKVAYDGVWMRAYAVHADHIEATIERTASVLAWIGISPKWLTRRVRQLASWQEVTDREILGAYAISVWLLSWDLENGKDTCQ
jgi:asparagine synthetase B (glutamine-hydrolysing)